jgi:p-hydroxybenzoate 3-monooxygenase
VIIGAGPAGLVLGNALLQAGLDCLIVEHVSRADIENRSRAGITDHPTRLILERLGLADGLLTQGQLQDTCEFRAGKRRLIIPYARYSDGIGHRVYPQHLLVRDLVEAFVSRGGELRFQTEAQAITINDESSATVRLSTEPRRVDCALVACCDGTHSIAHEHLPGTPYQRRYPYRWLTVLADVPAASPRLVYALHPDGFAGEMPRTTRQSRFYLQYGPDDDPLSWSRDHIWRQLDHRKPGTPAGRVLERGLLTMNTSVFVSMRHGPVHLLGDAAHALPPTGGKGMNLAIADADVLASAIIARFHHGDGGRRLVAYSDDRRADIWRAVMFSDWLLQLINTPLHLSQRDCAAEHRMRLTRLTELRDSPELAAWFSHAYTRSDTRFTHTHDGPPGPIERRTGCPPARPALCARRWNGCWPDARTAPTAG